MSKFFLNLTILFSLIVMTFPLLLVFGLFASDIDRFMHNMAVFFLVSLIGTIVSFLLSLRLN